MCKEGPVFARKPHKTVPYLQLPGVGGQRQYTTCIYGGDQEMSPTIKSNVTSAENNELSSQLAPAALYTCIVRRINRRLLLRQ